jgi:hypothetical protein
MFMDIEKVYDDSSYHNYERNAPKYNTNDCKNTEAGRRLTDTIFVS